MSGLTKMGFMAVGMGAIAMGLGFWAQKKKIEHQPKFPVEPPNSLAPTTVMIDIPQADSTSLVWEKFLNTTTQTRRGVDPKEAQIIFLGDYHNAKWQSQWRGLLIDRYGSHNTIVLCEGTQAGKKVMNTARSFITQKPVSAFGWDNTTASTHAIKHVVAPMNQLREKYKEHAPSSKWSKDDLFTWQSLLSKLELFAENIRTLEMIKTANTFLRRGRKIQGQKIFVIAGSNHLLNHKGCILHSFRHIKAALLLPQAPPLRDSAEAEYSAQLVKEMNYYPKNETV